MLTLIVGARIHYTIDAPVILLFCYIYGHFNFWDNTLILKRSKLFRDSRNVIAAPIYLLFSLSWDSYCKTSSKVTQMTFFLGRLMIGDFSMIVPGETWYLMPDKCARLRRSLFNNFPLDWVPVLVPSTVMVSNAPENPCASSLTHYH